MSRQRIDAGDIEMRTWISRKDVPSEVPFVSPFVGGKYPKLESWGEQRLKELEQPASAFW
jgi:hypothetical protein